MKGRLNQMPEVLLFHHANGQTQGFAAFADEMRRAGHTVHTPDMFEGKVFDSLEDGVAHAEETGFGAMPVQKLAQTRPGARGALLFHAFVPVSEFSDSWPESVPVQVHGMDTDPYFAGEGDLEAARDLAESVEQAELFIYPGDQHLFAGSSLDSYDENAATALTQPVLDFLETR